MEKLHKSGAARSIGVSNFTVKHLEHLFQHCTVKPAVNQVAELDCWSSSVAAVCAACTLVCVATVGAALLLDPLLRATLVD